ncbi:DLW-39 family protein [Occultella glacieicola]|nr:DLW-39 family protein [Occultella glacieicola]
MKKFLTVAAVAVAGYVLWRKFAADRTERDLWAEVTDPLP